MVLNQIEQGALYNAINFQDSCDCQAMSTVRRIVIATFFCPSDPNNNALFNDRTTPGSPCLGGSNTPDNANGFQNGMMCNYSGSYGDGYSNKPGNPYDTAGAGLQYGCGGGKPPGAAGGGPPPRRPTPPPGHRAGPPHPRPLPHTHPSPPRAPPPRPPRPLAPSRPRGGAA